ncbi:MAG TPA: NUDIX hydrolase [Pyrinomonadaceae bacterium]
MAKEKGPWTVKETAEVYRTPWVDVVEDKVIRPDGTHGIYTTMRLKPGVSVLALDGEGFVHLTSEYRYAVERESVEVVSGGVEEGETPLDAAQRELREELGITAREWTDLGSIDPLTSMLLSPTQLFLARGLTHAAHEREGTEVIRALRAPLSEAVRMVMDGEITHAPSCVLILKAHLLLSNGD